MEEEPCTVCGKSARSRCGNCKAVFYCSKEHQKSDWQRHKLLCKAWEIREFPDRGRCIIATRDLNPGDVIISEPPIIWGPIQEGLCVGCGAKDAWARCPHCFWPVCTLECPGIHDPYRHGFECMVLTKSKLIPRYNILLPLKMLVLRRRHPKRWEILSKMESHVDKRGPGTEADREVKTIADTLNLLMTLDPASRAALPQVCGIIDVNALETNPPDGSVALYETACLIEHNCIANTRYHFNIDAKGRPRITVSAVTSIKKGDHISTTYTHVLWCTKSRREHLLATKHFVCNCKRCLDPTELGSHLGSFKCPCGNSFMTPTNPIDPKSEWSCNACPGILSSNEVNDLFEKLKIEVDKAMEITTKDALTDLLSRLTVLLHPNHQFCITASHSLLQLLPPDDPTKVELCKRIIDITAIVDPYNSRLNLYTVIALRELASCAEIQNEERRKLLEKAISYLHSEPPNSAGDKLLKIISSELER